MNGAHKAQAALEAKDYPAAIALLTSALKTSQSPLWLIQRSTAYQRNNQHELALADADNSVLAARNRGKRELIATAHLRRAIALNALGRYGDARLCLIWTTKFNDKEKGTTLWMSKNKQDFDRAGGNEAECNQITVKEIPDEVKEVASTKEEKPKEEKKADKGKGISGAAAAAATTTVAATQTPKEKVRQEWYQSTNTVTIEIFAKGIPKENVEIDIGEGSVSGLRVAFVQELV
jgi:suppressor of G2 allele of SKP1